MSAIYDKISCIPLITSQQAIPKRTRTKPVCKLLNPAGVGMASHGFVYMPFNGPMWIGSLAFVFLMSLFEFTSTDLHYCI